VPLPSGSSQADGAGSVPSPARPAQSVAAQVDWLYLRPRRRAVCTSGLRSTLCSPWLPSTDQAGAPFDTSATNVRPRAISNGFPAASSKTVRAVAPQQVELGDRGFRGHGAVDALAVHRGDEVRGLVPTMGVRGESADSS
jgi:hypothetical protein